MKKYILVSLVLMIGSKIINAQEDPYIWLEDVDSKKSLEFVEKQNQLTIDKLTHVKEYQKIYDKTLEVLNSTDRIVYPAIYGDYIYNFWQDQEHRRGIWRRTLKNSYISGNPVWETLLDIDALSVKDDVKWVYKGASGLYPDYNKFLVMLSKGGGDAVVIKEFDVAKKEFIQGGFYMDEAKGSASYLDENTLIVSTDFGSGTMTSSGYPRQVRLWKRGTELKTATLIYEGGLQDVSTSGYVMRDGLSNYLMINKGETFYSSVKFLWWNDKPLLIDIPQDCDISGILNNQLIVQLKSDYTVNGKNFKQGSLVSYDFTALLKNEKVIQLIYEPNEQSSISGVSTTKNKLLVDILNNVKGELYCYSFDAKWKKEKVNAPDFGTLSVAATDEFSDLYFFNFTNFLEPSTLYIANAQDNSLKPYKSLPAYFDATKYKVEQYKAKSKDGTMVPYFVVCAKNIHYDGNNPTLLYAYGGFEVSSQPFYSGVTGNAWLENGGVYVLANIRGGGEFGPKWHQAGLKEKRQNIYNDFHAIAEELISKKITSPKHLGIMGGSNGGLLVGVAFTQRPDLYNAVVCQVPLLDMKRYNKLLAGASWMGEYGDPDKPEEWAYIKNYSPYQNLKKDQKYPEVFFTTSTRDDRVHPGHARKMVAKMIDMGYPVYYYENTEGGHAGSSTNEQRAKTVAMQYSYLLMKLKNG